MNRNRMSSPLVQRANHPRLPLPRLPFAALLPLLVLGFFLTPFSMRAQDTATGGIRGRVLDRATRSPIAAANVIVPGTRLGAAADLEGTFTLSNLPPGTYRLTASAVGYLPKTIDEVVVTPGRSRTVEFLLEPATVKGEDVTLTARKAETASPDLPTSTRSLRYEEVRRAPGAAEDVQRTVQALPGVVNQNDQDNEIVVRGGSPLENMTVIDGLEVDNTDHFTFEEQGNGGSINALSTEFLQDVTFAAGGFSARYGDRMSSVLDLNLREGSRNGYGGAAELGMLGLGGYVEGPLPGRKGSLLATVHRSYLEALPRDAVGLATVPVYWSSQAKLTYDLSPTQLLTVNSLYAQDYQTIDATDKQEGLAIGIDALRFGSSKQIYGARLRSLWGSGFTDVIVGRALNEGHWKIYRKVHPADPTKVQPRLTFRQTDITDQINVHWTGRAFGRDEWGAGASLKPITFRNDSWTEGDSILYNDGILDRDASGAPRYDGTPDTFRYQDLRQNVNRRMVKYASYLQYTWRPSDRLALTGGLRHDGVDYAGKNVLGPRTSLNWEFRPAWSLNLAWGIYYQSQLPSVYMDANAHGANRHLPYSRADQYIAGVSFAPRASSFFSLEGYVKNYRDLLVGEQDIVREETGNRMFVSEVLLPFRKKRAWGVELFAQQKLTGRWYGTFSYSYGDARSTDPAFGTYPADYDFRHAGTLVLGYKTSLITNRTYRRLLRSPFLLWLNVVPVNGDELTLSARYRYLSGRPLTRTVWYSEGAPSPQPIYEGHWEEVGHNNDRYPAYSRLDLRLDSKYYYGSSALIFYLEIQNLLDHPNVAQYFFLETGQRETAYQFRQVFALGLRYEF